MKVYILTVNGKLINVYKTYNLAELSGLKYKGSISIDTRDVIESIPKDKSEVLKIVNRYLERHHIDHKPHIDGITYFSLNDNNSIHTIEYRYNNVEFKYLGRITWCIDDLDFFVDYSITVDGKCIVSKTKD